VATSSLVPLATQTHVRTLMVFRDSRAVRSSCCVEETPISCGSVPRAVMTSAVNNDGKGPMAELTVLLLERAS